MTTIGQELYDSLGAHKDADQDVPGQPLRDLAEACIMGLQPVEDVIRDDDDGPGWSKVMDPTRSPSRGWLEWLANFAGLAGKDTAQFTLEELRSRIQTAQTQKRGTRQALIDTVKEALTGTKQVYVTERSGGFAYQLKVATRASETPSTAAVLRKIAEQKPGGIVLTYMTVAGGDYASVEGTFANYAGVLSGRDTYADLLSDPIGP